MESARKEITARAILREAARHIEANGCLFGAWNSGDDTADLPPCCCLVGTMRLVAGLPPTPPDIEEFETEALTLAAVALAEQTKPERISLGWERHGTDHDSELTLTEWSDHYADVEAVRSRRRGGHECRRLEHADGDREHIVSVMRHAADRCAE